MKIKKNPKITPDSAVLKRIGEVICEEIKDSLRKNSKIYARAKRSNRQYNQITDFDAEGKICDVPWFGAADYFVPMTEWIVDAVHSRVMNILFGIEGPYMTAKGTGPEDVERAAALTDFVDGIFREEIHLYEKIGYFFKKMLILPISVIKYEWDNRYEPQIAKDSALSLINKEGDEQLVLQDDPAKVSRVAELIMNGYQPQPEPVDVWVRKDKEIKNGTELTYIRLEDYVWTPGTERGKKPHWEGDRTWLTINDMNNGVRDGKLIKESIDRVKESINMPADNPLKKIITERSTPRECFNWYGRLPFNANNEIDFNSDTAIEQEVYALVEYETKNVLYIGFWEYERMPNPERIYIRDFYEESDGFDGRSLVDKLYKTQYELNDVKNTIMNNAWIAMQKIFVKRKSADPDLDDPAVFPGAIWEETQTGDIRMLNVGDVKAVGIEIEDSLISFAERISNISLYQTGTAGKSGKTKGEVEATIYEGNLGINRFIGRCHNVLRKICDWTGSYYYERMPEGLEKKIRGNAPGSAFGRGEGQVLDQNQPRYWKQQDLEGWNKFNWIWNGTTLTSDKNRNILIANDLMKQFLPVPMIGGNLMAVWHIMKMGLEARGITDWQNILPPKEAILQEMKKMEAEAQQAKKPGPEEIAIQKLTEKGIPLEKATQLVQAQAGGGNVQKLISPERK